MLPFIYFLGFALLWAFATCNPRPLNRPLNAWNHIASNQKFTLQQVAVKRSKSWSHELRRAYIKHNVKPPAYIEQAIAHYEALEANQTASVGAKPYFNDMEYLINAQVGDLNLTLNLDTGSADLWVFSTLQATSQRIGRPRLYDPKRSGGMPLKGHTWEIEYGDGSSANGQVYLDKVGVGAISYPNQAIGAAAKVSTSFALDQGVDGLMGLAFSKINAVKPKTQLTWFDNVKPKLAAPVFTCTLKRHQTGSYDFGFIDKKKYKGDITWVDVKQREGFWDFGVTGFAVGNGRVQNTNFLSMADTGTSIWYAPPTVANTYWASVPGSSWSYFRGGFTFPCDSKLPDMTIMIGVGKNITVPGINMNYQTISSKTCYGGLQRTDAGGPKEELHIAGDTFLKNLFVAFEHPVEGPARLGFAQQA